MAKYKVGDCVSWNSEGGRAVGNITKIHYKPFSAKGYKRHATKIDPTYEIKVSSGSGIAYHFATALTKVKCR